MPWSCCTITVHSLLGYFFLQMYAFHTIAWTLVQSTCIYILRLYVSVRKGLTTDNNINGEKTTHNNNWTKNKPFGKNLKLMLFESIAIAIFYESLSFTPFRAKLIKQMMWFTNCLVSLTLLMIFFSLRLLIIQCICWRWG